jgi:ABC-type sugar transport system permease subunit
LLYFKFGVASALSVVLLVLVGLVGVVGLVLFRGREVAM